jgi:hypothetical protein
MSALKAEVQGLPPWTQSIEITAAARGLVSAEDLATMSQGWFSQPLLAMPLAEVVVLLIALNGVDIASESDAQGPSGDVRSPFLIRGFQNFEAISSYRWICMASLTQIILTDVITSECYLQQSSGIVIKRIIYVFPRDILLPGNPDGTQQIGRKRHVDSSSKIDGEAEALASMDTSADPPTSSLREWEVYGLLEGIVTQIRQRYPLASRLSESQMDLLLLGSLRKWMSFVSLTLHIITRTQHSLIHISPDNPFPDIPEEDGALDEACLTPYTSAAGFGDAQSGVLHRVGLWLDAMQVGDATVAALQIKSTNSWSRRDSMMTFVPIPEEYTKLHGLLNSLCSWDYPALCMCCGAILNSGTLSSSF